MATTIQQHAREVEHFADHFVIVLAELELFSRAADTIVDLDDTMREDIEEAIHNWDPRPTGTDGAIEYYASVATIAALSTLGDTGEVDLEKTPLRPGLEGALRLWRCTAAPGPYSSGPYQLESRIQWTLFSIKPLVEFSARPECTPDCTGRLFSRKS